jgi:hypothetical protein
MARGSSANTFACSSANSRPAPTIKQVKLSPSALLTGKHQSPYELWNRIAKGGIDAMARGVLGSSISAALAYLAISGRITGGGPTDYKQRRDITSNRLDAVFGEAGKQVF